MIVSANQPYFAPFAGFFLKAELSDILVLMEDVQFPQRSTWLTRNRFKNDQGTLRLSVPVWKKGLGLQRIKDVRICNAGRWTGKHLDSLKTAYKDAPFFADHLEFLQELFANPPERLLDFNLRILRHILRHLRISTRLVFLSELKIDAKEPRLSVAVGKALAASCFLAQQSARKFLDAELFQSAGIRLEFFQPRPPVYPQLWGAFIPNLSALDLLFNCGPKSREILLRRHKSDCKTGAT
jgi:hypothetical protein